MERGVRLSIFPSLCRRLWGIEEEFRKIKGVRSTMVGYTGGWLEYPTYEHVCTDRTGHAEAIQIMYDPSEVSYADLLEVFWSVHNPTTKNRQGFDYGTQYRSAIFYHTPQQEEIARKSKEEHYQKYYQKREGGRCYF